MNNVMGDVFLKIQKNPYKFLNPGEKRSISTSIKVFFLLFSTNTYNLMGDFFCQNTQKSLLRFQSRKQYPN